MLNDEMKINEYKNIYKENESIGGQIICDYLLIKKRKLDIGFSNEDIIKEYTELLKQRLKNTDLYLLMMVNTEIEKCTIDSKEEIYKYLDDEIYSHWENCGKYYPKEAIGLHIDLLTALMNMNEKEMVISYLHRLEDTYMLSFEEDSYYFSIAWCHIISEVFMEIMPDVAVDLYGKYKNVFEKHLKNEDVLYVLILKIAAYRCNKQQNEKYLKDAVEYCKRLLAGVSDDIKADKFNMVLEMSGLYHRNIGDYDTSISEYKEVLYNTNYINNKMYIICQILSVLYMKKDYSEMEKFLKESKKIVSDTAIEIELILEYYNTYGMCCFSLNRLDEAFENIEYAKKVADEIYGENSDLSIKCQLNILYIQYSMGDYDSVYADMHELMEIIIKKPSEYKATLPMLLNNINAMFPRIKNDTQVSIVLRNALENVKFKYDIASNIIIYANIYKLSCLTNNTNTVEFDQLEKKLTQYYTANPYSEGYVLYLYGKLVENSNNYSTDIAEQIKILDGIEKYYCKSNCSVIKMDYYHYYLVKLEKMLLAEKWSDAKKYLDKMWENIIFPILEYVADKKQENIKGNIMLLRRYVSLYISAVQHFKQLKITDREIYEYVMNYKYYEDLIYYNKYNTKTEVKNRTYKRIQNVNINKNWLVLDSIDYNYIDLRNITDTISKCFTLGVYDDIHRLYFAIDYSKGMFSCIKASIIGDVEYSYMDMLLDQYNKSDSISELEKKTSRILADYIYRKDKIFVCRDMIAEALPLSVLRLEDNIYWGEKYHIVYCNIIQNVKEDMEVEDISDSIFMGMSLFDGEDVMGGIKDTLCDIPYVENEISELSEITGGRAYIGADMYDKLSQRRNESIIHIATHTVSDENTNNRKLVVGRNSTGEYKYFTYKQISECDWRKTKLVVLSSCETNEYDIGDYRINSLSQAARIAGASYIIATTLEVEDGVNLFFMMSFYKNLKKYKKIEYAFYKTQEDMRTLTKKKILDDKEYKAAGMEWYLQNYDDYSIPFELERDWGNYILSVS